MVNQLSVEEYDIIISEALESYGLKHKRVLRYDGVFKHIIFSLEKEGKLWKRNIEKVIAEIEFESAKVLGMNFVFETEGNYHTLGLKRGDKIRGRFISDKVWGEMLEIKICDEEKHNDIVNSVKIIATNLGETIRVQHSKGKYRNYSPN